MTKARTTHHPVVLAAAVWRIGSVSLLNQSRTEDDVQRRARGDRRDDGGMSSVGIVSRLCDLRELRVNRGCPLLNHRIQAIKGRSSSPESSGQARTVERRAIPAAERGGAIVGGVDELQDGLIW
jgi:hypothetical protein